MIRRVDYPAQVFSVGSQDDLAAIAEKLELESTEPGPEETAMANEMERAMRSGLRPREKRIFTNMMRGETEESMAEDEGLSLRQVRRIVSEVRRKAAAAIGRVQ